MEGEAFELLGKIEKLRAMARGYFSIVASRQINVETELIKHSRKVREIMETCMKLAKEFDANDTSKKPKDPGFESMLAASQRVSRDAAHSLAAETQWRVTAKIRARACSETFREARMKRSRRRIDEETQEDDFLEKLQQINGGFTHAEEKFADGRMRTMRFRWEPADLGE